MAQPFRLGDCVALPDGRIGRVRGMAGGQCRARVMRTTSHTHQFLLLAPGRLKRVTRPEGWMSEDGYRRYLRVTLAKMRERAAVNRSKRRSA